MLPIKADQLKQASGDQDPLLSRVLSYIVNGWPSSVDSDHQFKAIFARQGQLTTEAGCILCEIRVVVPAKLRKQVLDELHAGHPGIVRMKSLARLHVLWPGIDTEIETLVHHCGTRQSIQNSQPPTYYLTSLGVAEQTVAMGPHRFCWSFLGHMYLIVIDAHSKWLRGYNDDIYNNRENDYRVT